MYNCTLRVFSDGTSPDIGVIDYYQLHYCVFNADSTSTFLHVLFYILYAILVVLLFYLLASTADFYFCFALQRLASKLHLSSDVAGVTLLSFGNGAPDFFTAFAGLNSSAFELVLGANIGATLFILFFIFGCVLVLHGQKSEKEEPTLTSRSPTLQENSSVIIQEPFQSPPQTLGSFSFTRNSLALFISVVSLFAFILDGRLVLWEGCFFVAAYCLYVFFVISANYCIKKENARQASKDMKTILNSNYLSICQADSGGDLNSAHSKQYDSMVFHHDKAEPHFVLPILSLSSSPTLQPAPLSEEISSPSLLSIPPKSVDESELNFAGPKLSKSASERDSLESSLFFRNRNTGSAFSIMSSPRNPKRSRRSSIGIPFNDSSSTSSPFPNICYSKALEYSVFEASDFDTELVPLPSPKIISNSKHNLDSEDVEMNLPTCSQFSSLSHPRLLVDFPNISTSEISASFKDSLAASDLDASNFRNSDPGKFYSVNSFCDPYSAHYPDLPSVELYDEQPSLDDEVPQGNFLLWAYHGREYFSAMWHRLPFWKKLVFPLLFPFDIVRAITIPPLEPIPCDASSRGAWNSYYATLMVLNPVFSVSFLFYVFFRPQFLHSQLEFGAVSIPAWCASLFFSLIASLCLFFTKSYCKMSESSLAPCDQKLAPNQTNFPHPTFPPKSHKSCPPNHSECIYDSLDPSLQTGIHSLPANLSSTSPSPAPPSPIPLAATTASTHSQPSPPIYYTPLFLPYSFIVIIAWIYVLAQELVCILQAIGVFLHISSVIIGLTVLAWGNSFGDLVTDIAVARRGGIRTAVAGILSGPLVSTLFSLGVSIIVVTVKSGTIWLKISLAKQPALFIGLFLLMLALICNWCVIYFNQCRLSRRHGFVLIFMYIITSIVSITIQVVVS